MIKDSACATGEVVLYAGKGVAVVGAGVAVVGGGVYAGVLAIPYAAPIAGAYVMENAGIALGFIAAAALKK